MGGAQRRASHVEWQILSLKCRIRVELIWRARNNADVLTNDPLPAPSPTTRRRVTAVAVV